jgi:ribonuclease HII
MSELVLGIDDAGRGPVIGPMILSGVLLEKKDELELKAEGVKDSKQVPHSKRVLLAEKIKKTAVDFQVIEKQPREIDNSLKEGINLNKVEALMAAEIINKINKKSMQNKKITVFIDCPSPNLVKWKAILLNYIAHKTNLNIKTEHKADINHVSCSAASILAKVRREESIEELKKKIGVDFGSGYPSDPVTKKFLESYYKKYQKEGIFRESWSTISGEKEKKQQKNLLDF